MIPIFIFIITVALTLGITWWAARRSHGTAGFYTAEGKITAGQNGLAITGDFISAAGLLGTAALYFSVGLDSVIFLVSPLVGLCLLLLLVAGPLRQLGKFTLGDVLAAKLPGQNIRIFTGISTVVLSEVYLVAQFVAAGSLFAAIFDVTFFTAIGGVAALIVCYVVFGGMLATTWVQITKAVLLIAGVLFTAVLCVVHAGGIGPLYEQAQAGLSFPIGSFGAADMGFFAAASLCTALILGMMGMPHLLIRFLTVPDARAAEKSVAVAAVVVALVLGIVMLVIGPAGIAFVKGVPAFESAPGEIRGGVNMILLHLATALGGEVLFGLLASVAFTTILAVVAGLTIALSASAAHDIYGAVSQKPESISEKQELIIFRVSAVAATVVGALLAIMLRDQNVTLLAVLAFSIAASTNFPVLILALYWSGLTSSGAIAGGLTGLALSVAFMMVGPTMWVAVLGNAEPLFPTDYGTLIATPAAFLVAWTVSLLGSKSGRRAAVA